MRNSRRPFTPRLRARIESHVGLRGTIGTLHAFDPLRPLKTILSILPILTIAAALEALAAPVAIPAVTIATIAIAVTAVLPVAESAITTIVTIPVTPVAIAAIPVMELSATTTLETLAAALIIALLPFVARLRELLRLRVASAEFTLFVAVVVAHRHRLTKAGGTRTPGAVLHLTAALSHLLLAERHDDAIVVLGVLEIILRQHGIARGLRVARESNVLFRDMGGRAPQLDVRARAFEAPRQGVLPLAILIVIIVVVVAAASSAVLLSLPHGLHSRQVAKIMCCGAHAWQHANSIPSNPYPSDLWLRPSERNPAARHGPAALCVNPTKPSPASRLTSKLPDPAVPKGARVLRLMRTPSSVIQIRFSSRALTAAACPKGRSVGAMALSVPVGRLAVWRL